MVATPNDAATVVLMREAPAAGHMPEVLLLKQQASAGGAAEVHGFPGRLLEATDVIPAAQALSPMFPLAAAAARLSDGTAPAQALGCWIAALRAAFEATGVLLARHADGRLWQPSPDDLLRLAAQRRFLRRGESLFVTMMHDLELYLATDLLVYCAHWITPEGQPRRLSTRFFLTQVPQELTTMLERVGAVEHVWLTPAAALQRHADGVLEMLPVTAKILQDLCPFPSVAAAIEHWQEASITTVLPKVVVQADGSTRLLYPWDEDY